MDLNAFTSRKVAVLFTGDNLPPELEDWSVSDLDLFFENLDMWAKAETPWIESLFSSKISGIRQHVADTQSMHVVCVGERLQETEAKEVVKKAYLNYGYLVIEWDDDGRLKITECPSDKVRISLR